MLGMRSTAAAHAAVRSLRFLFNHRGGSSSNGRTLGSRHSHPNDPIKSSLASNANTCLRSRNNDRKSFFSSIRLCSTCSDSIFSTPSAADTSDLSNSTENSEADTEVATTAAYVAMRNAAMDDAYYAIELALDSVVKIFTVASSPRT
ncbi:hypothetical protein OROGR_009129 [Orobanche gracilis]